MDNISLNLFDSLITHTTTSGEILDANDIFLKVVQKSKEKIVGRKENEIFSVKSNSYFNSEPLRLGEPIIRDETLELKDGIHYYTTKKELIIAKKTNIETIVTTRKDITIFKQYQVQNNEHNRLLKYIASGASIEFILNEIIKSVEIRNKDMICSILILSESKKRLLKGASPTLPEFYTSKLDNMLIGEKVGSCGAAVYLKERVIVADISKHENWKYAKKLAAKANLHACWSQPFFSSSNEVLGSFAIYYNRVKEPSDFDIHLIEDIASIVGIAIENSNYKITKKKQDKLLIFKMKQAMMGEMIENIAHQWRQPLSVIASETTAIKYKDELKVEHIDKTMNSISDSVHHLSATIEDFRTFFKHNKKGREFSISDTFEKILKLISSQFSMANIYIVNNIQETTIFGFENELIQVIINIFNNARDELIKKENQEKFIFIDVLKEENSLEISIKDNAGGIPKDIIGEIFSSHFTTKEDSNGTGIGLYMSKMIIEEHMKGEIKAANIEFMHNDMPYYGAQFKIKLPIN